MALNCLKSFKVLFYVTVQKSYRKFMEIFCLNFSKIQEKFSQNFESAIL